MVALSIALGWINGRFAHSITGKWESPIHGEMDGGYKCTLEILADGTFRKFDEHRTSWQEFTGKWRVSEDSEAYEFIVLESKEGVWGGEFFPEGITQTQGIKKPIVCWCAIDRWGKLVIRPSTFSTVFDSGPLRWDVYQPVD